LQAFNRESEKTMKRMKSKYASFKEAKNHFIEALSDESYAYTLRVNAILLTARSLENHVKKIAELKSFTDFKVSQAFHNKLDYNDMKRVSTLRAHIKFLQKRSFVFKEENNKIQLIDYIV